MNNIFVKLKLFIPFLLFLSLAYFLWHGLKIDVRIVPSALIGGGTPEFNLPRLTQPEVMLTNTIFKGQVSLLNVWATWCVTCAQEHPILMDIAAQHRVTIYGLDYKDQQALALNYLHSNGNPYTEIGFDSVGNTAINWGVYGTPETFIIDKQGIIRYKQIGAITPQIWQDELLPLIEKLEQLP